MAILLQLIDRVVSTKFELDKDHFTIGRNTDCDLVIGDLAVSGLHAVIERDVDPYYEGHYRYFFKDMGSTNGSFINNNKVTQHELKNNDALKIGWNEFKFLGDNYQEHEETAHILDELH